MAMAKIPTTQNQILKARVQEAGDGIFMQQKDKSTNKKKKLII